ncbi:MAG TPA: hypothetical protein VN873_00970 [Candidatus Angelobacter sp.]|nr:hypothetical protein [Candidatus Angelobacter sp.]
MNLNYLTLNKDRAHRPLAGWCAAVVLIAGIAMGAGTAGTQTTTNNSDSVPSPESFQIITRNNIFDPNRSPRYVQQQHTQPRVVDTFALVGTMSYSKGTFAFFDGSDSQFKKVLEPGGNIAGYTVKDITKTNVMLAANGKEIAMNVGTQMRKEEGGGWKLSDYVEAMPGNNSNNDATAVDASTPPTGENAEQDAVLKRLMQLKQQELNGK